MCLLLWYVVKYDIFLILFNLCLLVTYLVPPSEPVSSIKLRKMPKGFDSRREGASNSLYIYTISFDYYKNKSDGNWKSILTCRSFGQLLRLGG